MLSVQARSRCAPDAQGIRSAGDAALPGGSPELLRCCTRVGVKALGITLHSVPLNAELATAYGYKYGYGYDPGGSKSQ
jgi:hypothetical protein